MTDSTAAPRSRLKWIDGIRGTAILWIVFFHFFNAFNAHNSRFPWILQKHFLAVFLSRCAPSSVVSTVGCWAGAALVAITDAGFHAVGVFIVVSGFSLAFVQGRKGDSGEGWLAWYRARLLRLFPMYWVAHLLLLVSPFTWRGDPIDYRFILSFLGDRIYPLDSTFYYFNPSWWYLGVLFELYIVFPFLFRVLKRLGPGWFLIICGLETIASRYLVLSVLKLSGDWTLGAFFGCRLWEFAFGMVVGFECGRNREALENRLFSRATLLAGILIYVAGWSSYHSLLTYTLTDALTGTGLFIILAHLARRAAAAPRVETMLTYVGVYSYGFYLIHQPYVLYFGDRMQRLPVLEFLPLCFVIIAVIAIASARLEQLVNRLAERVLGRAPVPAKELTQARDRVAEG